MTASLSGYYNWIVDVLYLLGLKTCMFPVLVMGYIPTVKYIVVCNSYIGGSKGMPPKKMFGI